MRVNYLGPAVVDVEHPAVAEMDRRKFPPSCFLVEISDEAKPGGSLMEGDVLVVDEARSYGHGDLVVAEVEGEYRLFKTHRVGSRCRLLPANGGQGCFITVQQFRGVVVRQARCWAV
ncbi:MAG: LexA family protein [Halomonas sp.]|uniref:LexA family protein n=1 Tax=Halomonas sp. TaxID=1486246 RepID=UPI003F902AFC